MFARTAAHRPPRRQAKQLAGPRRLADERPQRSHRHRTDMRQREKAAIRPFGGIVQRENAGALQRGDRAFRQVQSPKRAFLARAVSWHHRLRTPLPTAGSAADRNQLVAVIFRVGGLRAAYQPFLGLHRQMGEQPRHLPAGLAVQAIQNRIDALLIDSAVARVLAWTALAVPLGMAIRCLRGAFRIATSA
ncbi:MAG: hypothetical protein WDM86_21930 [Rhizomicrobium sp.]